MPMDQRDCRAALLGRLGRHDELVLMIREASAQCTEKVVELVQLPVLEF
ncbi:MAG: hypothetical protein WD894_12805 [Pirellulales bacterium]